MFYFILSFIMSIYLFIHNNKVHCESISTIRGVNVGGWLVLEPWITPSLFYSFLGTKNKIGMDMYSFCDGLGPVESNLKLREHWKHFQTLIPEYEMAKLVFQAKTKAFEKNSAGWIFWYFRTESDSYQWNLLAYLELMDGTNNTDKHITYVSNTNHTYGINYATTGIIVLSVLLLLNIIFIIIRINMMYKRKNYYQLINTGEERRINTEPATGYYTI